MAKKNLSLPRRNSETIILGYRLPRYHETGKKVYVDFYCFDPVAEKMKRKKIHLDKYKTKKERRERANVLISTISIKLKSGWNPFCEAIDDRQFTKFDNALNKYVDYIEKTCRPRTVENYRSRVKVIREYNETRYKPIVYTYEFTTSYVTEFLDYVLLDRDSGARTRNNYKGWCSVLSEWMISRKYINNNPTLEIPKLHEESKKRQPLSKEKMRKLRGYLQENDRHFLLACLMEYFTFIRPTELTNLKISDIKIKEQKIFVDKKYSKNKRDGYVGLNRILLRLMLDLGIFSGDNDRYLFTKGFVPGYKKADADIFNKRWVQVRKVLGWGDEFQFYSLKDTGIRDLANDAGIVIARDQARHSDIATTNKYLGVNTEVHAETQDFAGALDDQ